MEEPGLAPARSRRRTWFLSPALLCVAPMIVAVVALVALVIANPLARFDGLFGSGDIAFDVCEGSGVELVRAAGQGDLEEVHALVDDGADLDVADKERNTPLGCAIPRDHDEVVAFLLERGADPNKVTGADGYAEHPLQLAMIDGTSAMVDALLEHGADVHAALPHEAVPLAIACKAGDHARATQLLDLGADPNGTPSSRPLVAAADAADAELVRLLLARGADLDAPAGGQVPTEGPAAGLAEVLEQLARGEANGPDTAGTRALGHAAAGRSAPIVDLLLERGVDPNQGSAASALHAVAVSGDEAMARSLLDAGADPNLEHSSLVPSFERADVRNPRPISPAFAPLEEVVSNGLPGTTTTVTSPTSTAEQETSFPSTYRQAPLSAALLRSDTAMVALLLEHGADPNRLMYDRYSPLYLAALDCDVETTQLLLAAGADPAQSPLVHQPAAVACPEVAALLS